MATTLPIEIYDILERKIGKDDARVLVKTLETTISGNIDSKWSATKYELIEEMEKHFATKAELKTELFNLRTELKTELSNLRIELNTELSNSRSELKTELSNSRSELKTDIANLKTDIINLGWKQKLYSLIIIFVIIITNPRALELIGKLLGLVK